SRSDVTTVSRLQLPGASGHTILASATATLWSGATSRPRLLAGSEDRWPFSYDVRPTLLTFTGFLPSLTTNTRKETVSPGLTTAGVTSNSMWPTKSGDFRVLTSALSK